MKEKEEIKRKSLITTGKTSNVLSDTSPMSLNFQVYIYELSQKLLIVSALMLYKNFPLSVKKD